MKMTDFGTDLIALGRAFDEAARIAKAQIASIPRNVTARAELSAIEAVTAKPVVLAKKNVAATVPPKLWR